jgi:uncharacterized protein
MSLNTEQIREMARQLMIDRKGHLERETGYIYYHGVRTAEICIKLLDTMKRDCSIDRDLLYAGALLHDVAKGVEPHAEHGAAIVRQCLAGKLPPESIESIAELVRMHNRRGQSTQIDQMLIQDADLLDHFGSQNVWLGFLFSASRDEPGEKALEYFRSEKNRGFVEWCRGILNFEVSREVLEEKIAFEEMFFGRFERELRGELD